MVINARKLNGLLRPAAAFSFNYFGDNGGKGLGSTRRAKPFEVYLKLEYSQPFRLILTEEYY